MKNSQNDEWKDVSRATNNDDNEEYQKNRPSPNCQLSLLILPPHLLRQFVGDQLEKKHNYFHTTLNGIESLFETSWKETTLDSLNMSEAS